MKKSNVILQAAVASALLVMVGSASAGTLSTAVAGGTKFATEDFGATTTAATAIVPGAVTYTIGTTNGIVINAGGKIYLTIRLANGTFAAAPAVGTITGTTLAVGGAGNGVVGAGVLSSDSTTVMYPVTFTAAATLGVGSTLVYTPAAGNITGVNTALATTGNAVTAAASLSAITPVVVAPSTTTAPNTGTAQAADIDGPIATAPIAVSSLAINAAVSALTGANPVAGSKVQIDLTATPVSSKYVTTSSTGTTAAATVAALGSVTLTDATTVAYQIDGATAYNTAAGLAAAGALVIDVTPDAGKSFPVGSQVFLDVTSAACGAPLGTTGISAALTATTAAAKVTLTVPAVNEAASAAPYWVCVNSPSAGNVAAPITPTITATLTSAIATSKTTTVTGTGYALGYNGSQYDVRNYVPAAATGYNTFVRVINTGSVSAAVSVALINDAGTVGTSGVLGTLAGGASTNFSPAQIEAVTGAVASTSRPRLRVTAPTNGLNVQTFLAQPNGTISDMTGAQ